MKRALALSTGVIAGFLFVAAGCGGGRAESAPPPRLELGGPAKAAPAPKPPRIAVVEKPVVLQGVTEPVLTKLIFDFQLPVRPRRARLTLRYSGVPGALSEDYKMGRFRDKIELNGSFLMDLNTYSQNEEQVVEHTLWISPGMFRGKNRLTFYAGDDGKTDGIPTYDQWELRAAELEFDW